MVVIFFSKCQKSPGKTLFLLWHRDAGPAVSQLVLIASFVYVYHGRYRAMMGSMSHVQDVVFFFGFIWYIG